MYVSGYCEFFCRWVPKYNLSLSANIFQQSLACRFLFERYTKQNATRQSCPNRAVTSTFHCVAFTLKSPFCQTANAVVTLWNICSCKQSIVHSTIRALPTRAVSSHAEIVSLSKCNHANQFIFSISGAG